MCFDQSLLKCSQIMEIPNCGNSDYQNGWNLENLKQKINEHKMNTCL